MTKKGPFLIKFVGEKINFPNRCPVCGEVTTMTGAVGLVLPSGKRFTDISRAWEASLVTHRSITALENEVIRVNIPVCSNHYSTPEYRQRMKRFATLLAGLGTLLLIMTSFFIISTIIFQRPFYPPYVLLFLIALPITGTGYYFLRPTPLERFVKIFKGASSSSMITLQVKHRWYAKELLSLNPDALPMKIVSKQDK